MLLANGNKTKMPIELPVPLKIKRALQSPRPPSMRVIVAHLNEIDRPAVHSLRPPLDKVLTC
ncbi:hypothetical protein E2C01_030111 [Portunus trituberculatus]|uniref:Uncharacterized protein n=1 Tax=Portunus trituberculatus TaxID=210409 RepID=A0A5B7EWG0_PORTR|nr:hypothetical protein [Portunus trituberculatus]